MSDASDPRHYDAERFTRCLQNEGDCKAADCPEHGFMPRRRLHAKPEALVARGLAPPPRILLTVKLDDGTFESSLAVPIDAEPEALKATGEAWVELMFQALRVAKQRSR